MPADAASMAAFPYASILLAQVALAQVPTSAAVLEPKMDTADDDGDEKEIVRER